MKPKIKIKTKNDFKLLGVGYGPQAYFPEGEYVALHATNQPNWEEQGLVFIENETGTSLLLDKDCYTIV
jgi:hypothetical protein